MVFKLTELIIIKLTILFNDELKQQGLISLTLASLTSSISSPSGMFVYQSSLSLASHSSSISPLWHNVSFDTDSNDLEVYSIHHLT